MNFDNTIVPYLFLVTFLIAIGVGVWQYLRARKARREHHQSADARVHGDKPSAPGSMTRQARAEAQTER